MPTIPNYLLERSCTWMDTKKESWEIFAKRRSLEFPVPSHNTSVWQVNPNPDSNPNPRSTHELPRIPRPLQSSISLSSAWQRIYKGAWKEKYLLCEVRWLWVSNIYSPKITSFEPAIKKIRGACSVVWEQKIWLDIHLYTKLHTKNNTNLPVISENDF